MTSIDEAARLAALIRAQMAGALQRKAPQSAGKGLSFTPQNAGASSAEPTDPKDTSSLPPSLLAQIQSLTLDAAAPRRAFRLFLRATLAQQLGKADEGDASFEQLVNQVIDMMMTDDHLRQSIQEAGEGLLERAANR